MIHIAGRISCEDLQLRTPEETGATVARELAPASGYPLVRPIFFDTDHASERARGLLQQYYGNIKVEIGSVMLVEASNAFVVGQGAVVTRQRLLVTDSANEFLSNGLLPDGCFHKDTGLAIASREEQRLEGRCLLVKRPWYNNYGHWLVDLLPILCLIRDAGLPLDRILFGRTYVPSLKMIMEAAAEQILPGTPYSFVGDTEPIRVESLYYVSPVHVPPIGKHPAAIARLHDYGIANMSKGSGAERIFVSRRSGSRNIQNGEDVEHILSAHGFTTIFPEDLTFPEQVATFHDANVVVGIKGAALTNAVFCRPGTTVLVLSPSDFPDPFYWDLVSTRDLGYGELFCRSVADGGHPAHTDIIVDTDKLDKALAVVIERQNEQTARGSP